jgi:hypothetical protein
MSATSRAPRHRLLATSLSLALVFSIGQLACTDDPEPSAPPATVTPAPKVSVFEELLGLIPDTEETRHEVVINDFERLRRQRNITAPANPGDQAQKETYIGELARPPFSFLSPTFISGLDQYARRFAFLEQYLGYRRVDQDISAGLPPGRFEAVRGQFDPADAERVISSCGDCPEPQRGQSQGVPYYSWGEDFQTDLRNRLAPPAFDSLGRGGRVAVTDQYVFRTVWTEGIEAMIGAWKGAPSLRNDEGFRLAAQGIERLDMHSVYLTDRTQSRDAVEGTGDPPSGPPAPVLEPYTVLGVGSGYDSPDAVFTAIVLVHDTEEAAARNAQLLPQRIRAAYSVAAKEPWLNRFPNIEVKATGRVVEAKFQGSVIGPQFLFVRDPLLLHR